LKHQKQQVGIMNITTRILHTD